MSTLKATNIQNGSSSVANAVTTSGGDLTNAAGVSFMGGSKNLLYNGAMQVAQRGTSTASITTSSFNTADRWAVNLTTLGTWTQSVEADAPTGSGIRNSLKMLVTTADASPAAGDVALVCQILEGQDCQRIAKGTASAQQLTLSFWVKANVTGTYVAEVVDEDNSRTVSASYTISASATWEKKTITFPADTTGAITNDNTAGMRVNWWIGAGSTYTSGTLATTWGATTSANRAVGQTNLAAATNNYWQVTGVQLEVGPVATSFEFKSYGQELAECQRYYQYWGKGLLNFMQAYRWTNTRAFVMTRIPEMRTGPTLDVASGTNYFAWYFVGALSGYSNSLTLNSSSPSEVDFYADITAGTAGDSGFLSGNNAAAYLALSAEL